MVSIILTNTHSNLIINMSMEEINDLLSCMERILYFDWLGADVSRTTLTILLAKIDSILREVIKSTGHLGTLGGKGVASFLENFQRNESQNIESWIHNTRNIFEIYYQK